MIYKKVAFHGFYLFIKANMITKTFFSRLKFWFYFKKEKENLYCILVDIWFSRCTFFEYTTPNLEDYCKYYKEHIRGVLNSRICDYQWNGNTLYL